MLEKDEVKFEKFLSHMTRQCPNLKIVVAAAVNMRDAYEKRKLKSEKQKNDKEAAKLLPKISIEHVDK